MSEPAEILDEALQLPESERRAIALRLLDSVGDEPVEQIERRWIEEARRRREALADGSSARVPWIEARASIFARE